jgi:hypothetical protein
MLKFTADVRYNALLISIIIMVALFLLVIGPFIEIWAVNTLFKTSVEYSWLNWFCVIVLHSSLKLSTYRR